MNLDSRLDNSRRIKAPHGDQLVCRSWQAEAAMRMLMNNLDAEVAERPEELVGLSRRCSGSDQPKHCLFNPASRLVFFKPTRMRLESSSPIRILSANGRTGTISMSSIVLA
jgi:hypothetical protein